MFIGGPTEAVTLDDVGRVASQIIDPATLYLAVVGPYRSDKRFAGLLSAWPQLAARVEIATSRVSIRPLPSPLH